jgi:hypothetical protein
VGRLLSVPGLRSDELGTKAFLVGVNDGTRGTGVDRRVDYAQKRRISQCAATARFAIERSLCCGLSLLASGRDGDVCVSSQPVGANGERHDYTGYQFAARHLVSGEELLVAE